MNRILFVIFFFMSKSLAFGYYPLVNNYSKNVYRAGTQNWSITQSNFNLMYFANNQGLLEFDSKNWKIYPISNGTNIRSVLYSNGKIYAGAFNEFGYYEKDVSGVLGYHSLMPKIEQNVENINEIWQIHQGDNAVFFRADRYVFEFKNEKIRVLPVNEKINASALIHNMLFISSFEKGPCILNENMFIPIPGAEILSGKKVCAILPYMNNQILFVTSLYGVYYFDGYSIKPLHTAFDDFLIKNQVFCATTNGKQIVYGTVQKGIVIQNLNGEDEVYVNSFSGLQNNTVLSLEFDSQDNLWLGLDKGIDHIRLNTNIYNMFESNNLYGSGYTSLLYKNTLYFGTNQGLYQTPYPIKNNPNGLNNHLVNEMEGQVWFLDNIDETLFCGTDRGLYMIKNQKLENLSVNSGTWSVRKLKKHPDLLLGCSYQGLFILKKKGDRWEFSHYIKGDFKETSGMFEEDELGGIWISHWQKGVYRLEINDNCDSITDVHFYDKRKGFPTNRNNTFYKVGDELVFASEGGFYSYSKETDSIHLNQTWNGIFKYPPNSIRLKENKQGDVWCVSGSFFGLAKKLGKDSYLLDSLSYKSLQSKIILGFEHFNFIDTSNVIISTEDGFSWIDLDHDVAKNQNFKIVIRNVSVSQKEDLAISNLYFENRNEKKDIFPSHQNSIRIEFLAPAFFDNEQVKYSYILENFDKNWSEYNTQNVKEYTALPKGDYIFRVRAKDSQTSETSETYYSFTILPKWYETNFAYFVYFVLLFGCVVGFVFLIKRQIDKSAQKVKVEKEFEMQEQKTQFDIETKAKKQEITQLKNLQLEAELKHKAQEITSSTMNLMRKNEILISIAESLSSINEGVQKMPDNKDLVFHLNNIDNEIKQNVQSDEKNWMRFEENFDIVYGGFLTKLYELFPNLTLVEKRICAYIKMGLSSKEISSLLNLSVRSIETSRYRLRKKLDLSRDVNLPDFLQQL